MRDFSRILGYELRRTLLGRRYLYMLLTALLTALYTLSLGEGISGTAPFSAPSAAMWLSLDSAVCICMGVLLCRDIFAEKEQAARRVLLSAPVSAARYYAPKVMAVFLSTLLLLFLSMAVAGCSLLAAYGVFPARELLAAFGLFALPALIFVLGVSMVLGRIHPSSLYGFFLAALLFGVFNFPLPLWLDLFGNILYTDIAFTVSLRAYRGEPLAAVLPQAFLAGRAVFLALGLTGLAATLFRRVK